MLPVSSNNIYACDECINVPEVGLATEKFLGPLCAPVAEPPF